MLHLPQRLLQDRQQFLATGVSATLRLLRSKRRAPSVSSSRRICTVQRGLRQVQPQRGAGKAAGFGNCDESADFAEIQIHYEV